MTENAPYIVGPAIDSLSEEKWWWEDILHKDVLLGFMCIAYISAIYFVCKNYENNKSISNVLKNEHCNRSIFASMIWMGIGTLLYEYTRKDDVSFFFIVWLLVGIYGVLFFDETTDIHYYFAVMVFSSIFGFMLNHCHKKKDSLLYGMFVLQTILFLYVLFLFVGPAILQTGYFILFDFFCGEVALVANFAFFYLYLHFFETNGGEEDPDPGVI